MNTQNPHLHFKKSPSCAREILQVLNVWPDVKFMRDVTRGGLATVLNELAGMTGMGIMINESHLPVGEEVRGLCEIFGFDPLQWPMKGRCFLW